MRDDSFVIAVTDSVCGQVKLFGDANGNAFPAPSLAEKAINEIPAPMGNFKCSVIALRDLAEMHQMFLNAAI